MPTHDLPLETELILARTQDLRREIDQLRDQVHDRLQEVEQTRHQTQGRPHDLQHVLRIVQHALIQTREQPDLRHVRALLLEQGQDQAPQHEAVEVAAAVAALHEEEIIRHK